MSKIQIITGSTRPGRLNDQVADWIYGLASRRPDLDVEIVDIADYNLGNLDEPMPSMGQYIHGHTKKWSAKVSEADGYIFVAPEYNHGISGALKNALDFLYKEWNNKPAGFVGYGNVGGARSVEQLRAIAGELQIADVRRAVHFSILDDFENFSVLKPRNLERHKAHAAEMLDQLTAWARALKTVREEALVTV